MIKFGKDRVILLASASVASILFSPSRSFAGQTLESCTDNSTYCVFAQNSGTGGAVAFHGETLGGTGIVGQDTSGGKGVLGQSTSGGIGVAAIITGGGTPVSAGLFADGSTGSPGVYAQTSNSSASGVSGHNTSGSGGNGVYGDASGTGSNGVSGQGNSTGNGVYGASSITTLTNVAAINGLNSSGGYAGYFDGPVDIAGSSDSLYFAGVCYHGACASDRRLKQNIEPLKGALERLTQLNGVTFGWKEVGKDSNQPGMQTGFIAQDVEGVFPAWIGENAKGYKTLNIPPREFAALEVEAFKSLKARSDEQQARIDRLQAQLDKLDHRLDILTNGRDPISGGPGFGTGTLALMGLGLGGFAGASRLTRRRREESEKRG
jgi:Chaperone of endosialidase